MKFLPCLILSVYPAATTRAAVVDIPALKDTTLYESVDGSLANGGGSFLFAGSTGQAGDFRRRGLIEFDVAALVPAGAVINSAQLRLYADKGGTEATIVSLHRVTREWTEGTTLALSGEGQGATPVLGNDATWLHATATSVFWSGPGAAGDFIALPSSNQTITNLNEVYTWSGLEADVQTWLANSNDNHGWILTGDEESPGSAVRFVSRNHASIELRPVLRVDFTAVPEPSASLLPAMAILVAVRRRRQLAREFFAGKSETL